MRITILILFTSLPLLVYSQQLDCKDFKKGKFSIPHEASQNKEKMIRVIRTLHDQKEFTKVNDTIFSKIEWLSNCSYRITYDTNKMKLNRIQQWTQDNNGLVVTMDDITGKCISYKSVMTTKEGGKIGQQGKICIE